MTSNCRNTDPIHEAAYRYYDGEPVEPPRNAGPAVAPRETAAPQRDRRSPVARATTATPEPAESVL